MGAGGLLPHEPGSSSSGACARHLRPILRAQNRPPSALGHDSSISHLWPLFPSASKEEALRSEKTLPSTYCEYCVLSACLLGKDPKVLLLLLLLFLRRPAGLNIHACLHGKMIRIS